MTHGIDRLQRLETDPVLREEAQTLRAMVGLYCGENTARREGPANAVPPAKRFSPMRSSAWPPVPTGPRSPVCAKCRIHCYRAGEKAFAREVMRHAGPRLLLAHPVLSLRHLVKSLTVKAPEKPRNRTKTGKTNG